MANTPATFGFSRRIGSTRYQTNVFHSSEATESFEDKIMRLIRHEALDVSTDRGIMEAPQMSRQSERSAS